MDEDKLTGSTAPPQKNSPCKNSTKLSAKSDCKDSPKTAALQVPTSAGTPQQAASTPLNETDLNQWRVYGADEETAELREAVSNHLS